jgi:hypothetical protein
MTARSLISRLVVCLAFLPAAAAAHGRDVDRRLLEGLNLQKLGASLASHNGKGMWCPRCGATFVQGESCSECDIPLVPAGTPSA